MKTSRKGQTRRPLARIHVIHEALTAESWPNCSSLAERLEVSTKTIQRDLDFMRDEFRLPIEFNPERNGYHYTAPVDSFPPFQVGMEELMALFVARKVIEPLAGTEIERVLSEGFRRLSSLAAGGAHISWQELDQAFSIQDAGVMRIDLNQIETLSTALVQRQKLRFCYTNILLHRLRGGAGAGTKVA
ncbi:MAG: HTH domain-containing protein [Kiritimatiellia bacterium]